ncbi:MAG: pentapeptide repeat-containing protein [Actinomycetota bacterium]|nr:pentapeptide repeat-containing protein [Actinomycetota bacterium]
MSDDLRLLRADCASCAGLCCVVPAFSKSSDFAIDKPARTPCPNLALDFGCSIHSELRDTGFAGCTVYDCFGAGQRVVQELFEGKDWRTSPDVTEPMLAAFEVVERLHELLWYLADALSRPATAPLMDELEGLRETIREATQTPEAADVTGLQLRADALLGEVSALVRAGSGGADLRGRDLVGRDVRAVDLHDANLRGALLIGADLRGVEIGEADLLGADLRGARVAGADLSAALFLTQFQMNAARGDARTRIAETLDRPPHWT